MTEMLIVHRIQAAVEIAACFGFRDRILGIDSGERESTLARFNGIAELEQSYLEGWVEADYYCDSICRWARGDFKAA
jgi:hypothetical protein